MIARERTERVCRATGRGREKKSEREYYDVIVRTRWCTVRVYGVAAATRTAYSARNEPTTSAVIVRRVLYLPLVNIIMGFN